MPALVVSTKAAGSQDSTRAPDGSLRLGTYFGPRVTALPRGGRTPAYSLDSIHNVRPLHFGQHIATTSTTTGAVSNNITLTISTRSHVILLRMRLNPNDKPQIDYPMHWSYRVVGSDEGQIRAHVEHCLVNREHELTLARHSSAGRYVSLHLSVVVRNEADRLDIHQRIGRHVAVRLVL